MSARSPFCLKLHVLQVGGWIKRKRDLIFFLLRMFHFSFRGTEDAKFCVSLSGKQQGLEKKQVFASLQCRSWCNLTDLSSVRILTSLFETPFKMELRFLLTFPTLLFKITRSSFKWFFSGCHRRVSQGDVHRGLTSTLE